MTTDEMSIAALTAWTLDRAAGVPLPDDKLEQMIYMVGFAAGAKWALDVLKTSTEAI